MSAKDRAMRHTTALLLALVAQLSIQCAADNAIDTSDDTEVFGYSVVQPDEAYPRRLNATNNTVTAAPRPTPKPTDAPATPPPTLPAASRTCFTATAGRLAPIAGMFTFANQSTKVMKQGDAMPEDGEFCHAMSGMTVSMCKSFGTASCEHFAKTFICDATWEEICGPLTKTNYPFRSADAGTMTKERCPIECSTTTGTSTTTTSSTSNTITSTATTTAKNPLHQCPVDLWGTMTDFFICTTTTTTTTSLTTTSSTTTSTSTVSSTSTTTSTLSSTTTSTQTSSTSTSGTTTSTTSTPSTTTTSTTSKTSTTTSSSSKTTTTTSSSTTSPTTTSTTTITSTTISSSTTISTTSTSSRTTTITTTSTTTISTTSTSSTSRTTTSTSTLTTSTSTLTTTTKTSSTSTSTTTSSTSTTISSTSTSSITSSTSTTTSTTSGTTSTTTSSSSTTISSSTTTTSTSTSSISTTTTSTSSGSTTTTTTSTSSRSTTTTTSKSTTSTSSKSTTSTSSRTSSTLTSSTSTTTVTSKTATTTSTTSLTTSTSTSTSTSSTSSTTSSSSSKTTSTTTTTSSTSKSTTTTSTLTSTTTTSSSSTSSSSGSTTTSTSTSTPTSTTTSTSSRTTTTTSTSTKTSSTSSSYSTTSTTTSSSSSSKTTSTSTSTSTASTTTTTTTTVIDCYGCEMTPMKWDEKCSIVEAGSVVSRNTACTPDLLDATTACITGTPPTLECPVGNDAWIPVQATADYPKLHCRACGMHVSDDMDGREGFFSGTIDFGPNQIGTTISEKGVDGYRLVVADWRGVAIPASKGGVVMTVEKMSEEDGTECCESHKYVMHVSEFKLPAGAYKWMLVTQISTDSGTVDLTSGLSEAYLSGGANVQQTFIHDNVETHKCPTYETIFSQPLRIAEKCTTTTTTTKTSTTTVSSTTTSSKTITSSSSTTTSSTSKSTTITSSTSTSTTTTSKSSTTTTTITTTTTKTTTTTSTTSKTTSTSTSTTSTTTMTTTTTASSSTSTDTSSTSTTTRTTKTTTTTSTASSSTSTDTSSTSTVTTKTESTTSTTTGTTSTSTDTTTTTSTTTETVTTLTKTTTTTTSLTTSTSTTTTSSSKTTSMTSSSQTTSTSTTTTSSTFTKTSSTSTTTSTTSVSTTTTVTSVTTTTTSTSRGECKQCPLTTVDTRVGKPCDVMQGSEFGKCNATRVPSVCIEPTPFPQVGDATGLLFDIPQICPNEEHFLAITEYPLIRCWTCNQPTMTIDTDDGHGFYSGNITFGPNQLDGVVNEDVIEAYVLMKGDADGAWFGDVVHRIEKHNLVDTTCCQHDEYQVQMAHVDVSDAVTILVIPVTEGGIILPTGWMVDGFQDLTSTTTSTSSTTPTSTTLTTTITTKTSSTTTTLPPIPVNGKFYVGFSSEAQAQAAATDPKVKAAMFQTTCDMLGLDAQRGRPYECSDVLNITLAVQVPSRRLRGSMDVEAYSAVAMDEESQDERRRLSAAMLVVTYELLLPRDAGISEEAVQANVAAARAEPEQFLALVNKTMSDPEFGIDITAYVLTSVTVGEAEVPTTILPTTVAPTTPAGGDNATNPTVSTTVKRGITGSAHQTTARVGQIIAVAVGLLSILTV